LKEWLLTDWKFKLISVALALVLWFFVINEQSLEVVLSLPIEVVDLPQNAELVGDNLPPSVRVTFRAPKERVSRLHSWSLKLSLDLGQTVLGRNVFTLYPKNVQNLPRGIEVLDFSPSQVIIVLKPVKLQKVR